MREVFSSSRFFTPARAGITQAIVAREQQAQAASMSQQPLLFLWFSVLRWHRPFFLRLDPFSLVSSMRLPFSPLPSVCWRCGLKSRSFIAAITEGVQWNYTTVLNLIFLVIAAVLVIRFLHTGGPAMLKMMNTPTHEMEHHNMHSDASHHHDMKGQEMGNHDMHHHEMPASEHAHEQKEMES